MKAILFARVSSREQEETGYSLPAQQKLLEEYAKKKEFQVARIFSISESARGGSQRTTFNEMLGYVKKSGIKVIVCEKVDRLTRNLKDAVYVNEWINKNPDRQVHFVKENCVLNRESRSNEKFIWNIKVSVAQYYIDNLSEEVKKGQMEKIRQGWLPTKPPLGYMTVGEKGHKIHVVDDGKAPFIREIFRLYAGGAHSIKNLSQVMYEKGLRTRGGNKLAKSRLGDLLSDPFYYGKIRWNGKIYEGKQKPLLSRDTFQKVQHILKTKATPMYKKHFYLFNGLIKCTECKGKITWEKQKDTVYGHCNHYRDCQQKTWAREPDVEEQIAKVFGDLQVKHPQLAESIRTALKESHQDKVLYHTNALNQLKNRHEQIQQRLDRLYDDKLDEKVTKEFYQRKAQQYSEEKEAITESIEKHSRASDKYCQLGLSIYDLSQRARGIYREASLEEKRRLIRLVFDDLFLDEGKLSFTYSKPFKMVHQAVEFTNSSKVKNLAKSYSRNFEPVKKPVNVSKNGASDPEIAQLLRGWDAFRTLRWLTSVESPEWMLYEVENLLKLSTLPSALS